MKQTQPAPAAMPNRSARISIGADGKIYCAGAWTLDHLAELERQIAALPEIFTQQIDCDVGAITAMDTGGAWLLQRTLSGFEQNGCAVAFNGLSEDVAALLRTVARCWADARRIQPPEPLGWLERVGRLAWSHAANFHSALTFLGETASVSFAMLADFTERTHPITTKGPT